MRSASSDLRCKHCDALLAKQDRNGLALRRGDFQIAVTGSDFTASITCYRYHTLNVAAAPTLRASAPPPPKHLG